MLVVLAMSLTLATAQTADASSYESDFVGLINRERTSRGLHALQVAGDVVAVARNHSARMASRGSIYHNPNLGSEVDNWREVGENVGSGTSVGKIHNAFMDSAEHRGNILHGSDNVLGVGVVVKGGKLWVTQIFVTRKITTRTASSRTPQRASRAVVPAAPEPKPRRKIKPEVQTVAMLLRVLAND